LAITHENLVTAIICHANDDQLAIEFLVRRMDASTRGQALSAVSGDANLWAIVGEIQVRKWTFSWYRIVSQ
jgi:hypothetical protein